MTIPVFVVLAILLLSVYVLVASFERISDELNIFLYKKSSKSEGQPEVN